MAGKLLGYRYGTSTDVLPALPEWDKAAYPYAMMFLIDGIYTLYAMQDRLTYGKTADGNSYVYVYKPAGVAFRYIEFGARTTSTAWAGPVAQEKTDPDNNVYRSFANVIWTSADIYNTNGTVYMAATNPEPVYEESIFDADFLRGFHLGQAYRANLLRAVGVDPVATVSEDDEEGEEHERTVF